MIKSYSDETNMLYLGNKKIKEYNEAEVLPIYNSTAFIIKDLDDYDKATSGEKYYYSRSSNPNKDALGEIINYMEKGEKSLLFSSGMGAISTTLISLLRSNDHIIVNSSIYGETIELLDKLVENFNIQVTYVDFTDLPKVKEAIQINTRILYTEIISNPLIEIIDIDEISKLSKSINAYLIVDSTFTTPYLIKPLDHGVDIVIHSLTKFMNGHSDVTAGSITGSRDIISMIEPMYLLLGATLDPNSSWLVLRSIRTFELRMSKHIRNAELLAEFLNNNTNVRKVNYPSISNHPQHELAKKIFSNGFGNMISFRVEDNREKVNEFIHQLQLVKYLGTLGGYRTSLSHPATAFRNEFSEEQLESMGMYEGLIRISVGLEGIEDIVEDFEQALKIFS